MTCVQKNIKELRARFGDESVRISILEGMILEARCVLSFCRVCGVLFTATALILQNGMG